MVEKMYGPQIFYEDAANIMIRENYPDAADQCGEDIVSTPEVTVEQIGFLQSLFHHVLRKLYRKPDHIFFEILNLYIHALLFLPS